MFRFLALALMACPLVTSLRFEGVVSTSNDFTYIGKFAYGNKGGEIVATTKYFDPISQSVDTSMSLYGQKFALFPDVAGNWDSIEDSDLSCDDKLKSAGKTVYNIGYSNQPADPSTNESVNQLKLNVWGRRPHFWYVVLANCAPDATINQTITQSIDPSTGLPIVVSAWYEFELTNSGSMWTEPLSWEQHHISEIAITFLIVYVLLLTVLLTSMCRSQVSMKSTNQLMMTLLSGVVFCQVISQILTLSYQMEMIHQQTINQSINDASWWFDTFSQLGLLVSVMVLSANHHSVDHKIHRSQVLMIGVVMMMYVFGYLASFIVNNLYEHDHPSLTEWMFNNWGGYVLCAVRILSIGMIVNFLVTSINQSIGQSNSNSNSPSTRSLLFYAMFASAWLASFPVITLIASMTVSYWRSKFFYGVNCIVTFTFITCQVALTHRNASRLKSTNFKTMSDPSSQVETGHGGIIGIVPSEVSMSDINRSPDNSNPSSPRSPQSPSQGVRCIQPV